jgi:hypothetical protein
MTLEQAINSQRATDVLWDGLALASSDRVTFALCGAHWMDLSYLAGLHGRLQGRRDWSAEGSALLKDICTSAGWDVKEIANMIVWRNLQCK